MKTDIIYNSIIFSGIFNLIVGVIFFIVPTPLWVVKISFSISLLVYVIFAIKYFKYENENKINPSLLNKLSLVLTGIWNSCYFYLFVIN